MDRRRQRRNKEAHQNDKQRIIGEAQSETFDRNPLLNTPHQVHCKNCGKKKELVYLDYLKRGLFKLGETKPIEIHHPYASGFVYEMEQSTPIIIKVNCDRCKADTEISPINLEYLLFIIGKKGSELIYV